MQAASFLAPPLLPVTPSKNLSKPLALPSKLSSSVSSRVSPVKASPEAYEAATVDYSSTISVFPAEACETIGGEACSADIYPEVKLNPEAQINTEMQAAEAFEREYLEYSGPKTVFPAEACDDLGGEFCERPYQRGVY
ncbi:light-regulated protein, chloroplastic-like [Syzygium oleosum]|uniref:light-regulated protein, chloroplastic-like n=1 Tax=Syzygium oleosum TaxID=219896 RepID=UPI0011D1CD60|nr:light-regulated protein, chloroplastic-like [Syzygium oleosum]